MEVLDSPALTVAFALAAGLVAQLVAGHLGIPSLVLLLATGVVLGPDGLDAVRPESLGASLQTLVGFAVSVILFEGGLGLDLARLRREERAIRQLVIVGALVTTLMGSLAAHYLLGWGWRLSFLFGTLVIVTGPTVIAPLLRRIHVQKKVGTILEAEGVLIDAVGAIIAAVALEVALRPGGEHLLEGAFDIGLRLSVGAALGVLGGLLIALPLRPRDVVPESLQNVYTLSLVLLLFQASNALLHESGVAAVIAAGIVVRNAGTEIEHELREFKEQLTVLFIGMLFVLLAADVRLAEIAELGSGGLLVVAAVILLVRPVNVLVGTWGCGLAARQRVFLAAIGPRGIVAAAIASLFVSKLSAAGIEGGPQLRALVFAVITATVLVSGLLGGPLATLLGLRRKQDAGWVLLGAGPLARALAATLEEGSEEVVCIDDDARHVRAAEEAGIRVVFGNPREQRILRLAEVGARAGAIGLSPSEDTNLLFLQNVKRLAPTVRLCLTQSTSQEGVTEPMLSRIGAEVMFSGPESVERWARRVDRDQTRFEWRVARADARSLERESGQRPFLPMVTRSPEGLVTPFTNLVEVCEGCEVGFLIDAGREEAAREALQALGFLEKDESQPA